MVAVALLWTVSPGAIAQEADEDVYYLSLEDALTLALDNNLDLVSARFAPKQARQDVVLEDSSFDVGFESVLSRNEQESPATQVSTVTGSKSDNYQAGITQNLKYGADYQVGFGMRRNEQTGAEVVAPLSYFSGFDFTFTQPILKGFGTEATTERLLLAESNLEIAMDDLETRAEQLTETVVGAYWDVVAAREAVRVARRALALAEELLELNRKKVEVGTLAPIEITEAEAGVASRVEQVILTEVQLQDAEDELRRLLAIPPSDPIWAMSIVNTDRPIFEKKEEVDLEESIDTALASRSEMRVARQTVKNRELNERVAYREKRHQLDFNANYGPSGASLDTPLILSPLGFIVPPNQGSLGDSLSNIFTGDVYTWTATLTYRVPIGNRAAKANYTKSQIALQQSEVDLRNQEQTIRVEVRRAVRGVESGIKRVEAARKNVELQEEKLEAEQKKFDNGMSTSFEVLTFQNDLADAQLSEIRARLDYLKSLTALERAEGTLLESYDLRLEK
jgi:outer membrane protein TolC